MSYTRVNLKQVEDAAAKYGRSDQGEAHFAGGDLGLERSGVSYQTLKPGKRSSFGHTHSEQEEVFIILSGGGRMKLDDEVIEVVPLDAVRVGPGVVRALAAGEQGLEFVVYGAPKLEQPDYEMVDDWWSE